MARVFVGMSGGVDSSAAALLLRRQGHSVEGIHLRLLEGLPLPEGRRSLVNRLCCQRMPYCFSFS